MTGLDYIIQGVGTYDDVAKPLDELLYGLYRLNEEHPDAPYSPLQVVMLKPETINQILEAYRKLIN